MLGDTLLSRCDNTFEALRECCAWFTIPVGVVISSRKLATSLRTGHMKPVAVKCGTAHSRGPWYSRRPSQRYIRSSKRLKTSGGGCSRLITVVSLSACDICRGVKSQNDGPGDGNVDLT